MSDVSKIKDGMKKRIRDREKTHKNLTQKEIEEKIARSREIQQQQKRILEVEKAPGYAYIDTGKPRGPRLPEGIKSRKPKNYGNF